MRNIRKSHWVALSLLLLMGTLSLFGRGQENQVKEVSALEAYALMQKNSDNPDFITIDIRTPVEYKEGHLKGAVNINFFSGTFKEDIAKLDRSKTYLIHCRSGGRSSQSLSTFKELEFTHIFHMTNGILEWNAEGLPVEKDGE